MTPQQFIKKWRDSTLKERAASQSHFNDLCALLGEPTPTDADPEGTWYTFEKGATKTGGGEGWADVWKRGYFAWEYKGKRKDLNEAFVQLQRYAIALENPPLLVVSDMDTFIIHTNFTNTIQEIHTVALEDLEKVEVIQKLKWLFTDPERFRPGKTREMITEEAAEAFAGLAKRLREQGFDAKRVAHFVNKLLFCMFAEDIDILPGSLFSRLLESSVKRSEQFEPMAKALFAAMKDGGSFGADAIDWFNGGLFDDDDTLPLDETAIKIALKASKLDWSDIEPSIFGTLFERGLDPDKRSQLGAHYTDRQSIMRIITPVVIEPLLVEWEKTKKEIDAMFTKAREAKSASAGTKFRKKAEQSFHSFLHNLGKIRVLDPAGGSGNFLYLSLLELKNLEHRVIVEAEALGCDRQFPAVGPQNVLGIEINPYAAELSRVTVWIGYIQWTLRHGFNLSKTPILQKLENITNRDALLNEDGSGAEWPDADCIVSNPPFLGGQKMIAWLGEDYVNRLRDTYKGRVPGGADLVTYWFEKARAQIESGKTKRVGLVATNSIRGGSNRKVLERIRETGTIFNSWSDEPWINEGAAVRVSLVCFEDKKNASISHLNGTAVNEIYADLTALSEHADVGLDLTQAKPLKENAGVCFQGPVKVGAFDIPGNLARQWLVCPNPNGRPNSHVLRPWTNGMDITRRPSDTWIIDFGLNMPEHLAALYQMPFEYIWKHIKPKRDINRDVRRKKYWWLHGRTGNDLRTALTTLSRYIVTPRVSKYRLFVWADKAVLPDSAVVAIANSSDTIFGILHSRFHEIWSLKKCTWLGVGNDPRYTPTTTFETFPFPDGLTPNIPASQYEGEPPAQAIAKAARCLNELREQWLNPSNWVKRVPEVVPGYPDHLVPVSEEAAKELAKRTLTNLYNQRPQWLVQAHKTLDEAVAAAYGWNVNISDNEILKRLLELNRARS